MNVFGGFMQHVSFTELAILMARTKPEARNLLESITPNAPRMNSATQTVSSFPTNKVSVF